MAWRLAKSLEKLRSQINTAYPNRNKASDGTIGDPNHQAEGSGSDHNPNKAGVVCAMDITHDPANGLDIVALAQSLADSKDSRIKYLIRNSQIMVPADYGWTWKLYSGTNPHTSHLHISVYGDYDNTADWKIKGGSKMTQDAIEKYVSKVYRVATDIDATPEQAGYWVERIKADNNTAYELPVALGADDYKGDPMFRYKGRHYNEDMETAKKQAFDEGFKEGGGKDPQVIVNGSEYIKKK